MGLGLILLFLGLSGGVPFLILLDYHKKKDLRISVIYLVCFFATLWLIGFLVDELGFALLWLVILFPIFLFGILYLKNRK
jgi:hypothetical protein